MFLEKAVMPIKRVRMMCKEIYGLAKIFIFIT